MTGTTFNAEAYKAGQKRSWGSVATGWAEWWEKFESGAQTLSDRLIDLADIKPGDRVLDIATGIGEPAMTAAKRVGPEGRVVAIDLAPEMLDIARERANAAGMTNVQFFETDAETLDLPPGTFNGAICRWGLMFFPNLMPTMESIKTMLMPGGHFAAAVWSSRLDAPILALPMGIAASHAQSPPPPHGTPGPFALAEPGLLEQKFQQAGFIDTSSEVLTVRFRFESPEEFTRFQQAVAGPIKGIIADLSLEQQAEVWGEITEEARQYQQPDGTVVLPGDVIVVGGTVKGD